MVEYLLVISILSLALIKYNGILNKQIKWVFYILIPLFICFGYMTGSDWRSYEYKFEEYNWSNLADHNGEILYGFLCVMFRSIGFGFWEFSIFMKLLGYFVFLSVYKKLSLGNMWGFMYWFPFFAIYLWIDHPARNFMAIIAFSVALVYMYKRQFLKYLIICLVAFSFHQSAFALIPIYFIATLKLDKSYKFLFIGMIVMFIFSVFLRSYVDSIIPPFLMDRFESYNNEIYQGQSSIAIFSIIAMIILYATIRRNSLRAKFPNFDFVLNLSYVYGFLYAVGNINTIFFRLPLFLIIPYSILIGTLLKNEFCHKRKALKYLVIALGFFYMINLITKDYRYIPYSNYLEYTLQKKPTYQYRDNYNQRYSPYAK